ncbi:MAG TPA: hypothetical protein VFM23_09175 [Gemmatimonadales bacterium]|nr:hypothetical protein [Gemmatimonadales bacterium]
MKALWMLGLAVILVPGAAAQQDSVRRRGDTAEAERLRGQIEQRFAERVREELNLTQDQTTRLRASQEKFGTRRRALMRQQMERRRALERQMQPGVAANADSVRKLLDGIQAGRAEMLKIDQEESRELAGYLTPVQQARFERMRGRLMQRVGEMRRERHRAGQGHGHDGPRAPRRRPI